MNIAKLLGPHVDPKFVASAERARGRCDYPSFDLDYIDSDAYREGFRAASRDDRAANEDRRLDERDFPREVAADRRRGL